MKPNIHVLSLGGTIAMAKGALGVVPRLSAEELVGAVPQLADFANVRAESWRAIPGAHLDFDTLIALADKIRDLAARAVSGVVITQGTDTIEEAAFALDLMLDIALPVVVTGAMRNPTRPGADGPANMLAAVQVAASDAARRLGVVVVLHDEIHAARFVQKAHTSSLSTFKSDPLGPIGWLSEDQVRIALCPARRPAIRPAPGQARAKVAILKMALGDDGALVEAALRAGFDGLVVEAMGGGHVSPQAARAGRCRIPYSGHTRLAGRIRRGAQIDLWLCRRRDRFIVKGPDFSRPVEWGPGAGIADPAALRQRAGQGRPGATL